MPSPSSNNLRRIRRAIRSPRIAALPLQMRLLAHAVANPRAVHSVCARCHFDLPTYVDIELDRRMPVLNQSFIRQHLLICERCSKDYADLLETAILFSKSRLPKPSQMPEPDLNFLGESNG